MESVVFIIRKSDNTFLSYNILKMSQEKASEAVANFNKKEDSKDRAELITDQHTVAAILRKDSIDTIKSYFAYVKEECDRIKKELQDQIRCVENSVERMVEYVEEKFEDAPINSAIVPCQSHSCHVCCPFGDESCPKEPCMIARARA